MIVVETKTSISPSMKRCMTGLQLVLAHLSVSDPDARFGDELFERFRDGIDRLDPVVDEIDLSAAIQLGHDGALHDRVTRRHDDRLRREPVGRRGLNQREIAHAEQRHVQRARNRRRREREHVDAGAQLFEPLFVHDAEALFFIDHEQAEIFEDDVFLQEPVRADDDVDFAVGDVAQNRLLFFFRPEA